MTDRQFTFRGFLDHAAEHKHTFEFRVVKPTFEIGQEVEVYYYRTKRWHRAEVHSITLGFYLSVGSEYTHIEAYRWEYYCKMLDPSIAADTLDGFESSFGPGFDTIRFIEEKGV